MEAHTYLKHFSDVKPSGISFNLAFLYQKYLTRFVKPSICFWNSFRFLLFKPSYVISTLFLKIIFNFFRYRVLNKALECSGSVRVFVSVAVELYINL